MKSSLAIRALLASLVSFSLSAIVNAADSSKFFGASTNSSISQEESRHINISKKGNVLSNGQFSIDCINCSIVGDVSFSGGCNDTVEHGCIEQWAPTANFSMLPFNFTQYWLGVVFNGFKVHIELNITLTPSQPSNPIAIPLLGNNGLDIPFSAASTFHTDFNFNPQIYGWVNSTSPANFTYGFDYTIPDHSAVFIPVLHLDNVTTYGLSKSAITTTTFTSPSPNLALAMSLSFRPTIAINAQFLHNIFTQSLSFHADVPKLDLAVSQALNVTNNCAPPPPGTPASHIYHNLTLVKPSVSYDVDFSLGGVANTDKLLGPFDATALPTLCLDYEAQASATGLVVAPSVRPQSGAGRGPAVVAGAWLAAVAVAAVILG